MTNLQEVPTDELLSFQDYPNEYPSVHNSGNSTTIPIPEPQIRVNNIEGNMQSTPNMIGAGDLPPPTDGTDQSGMKSFWSIKYYQKYFDVDTSDVLERILASITPKWDNTLKHHLRTKPDLYGPFWISVTLIFTIAISGNITNYLQHASAKYHWKYDFHLVSYAATTIFLYVTLVPFILWGLLKWSVQVADLEGADDHIIPGALELVCVYGYSLFIYIPVSILWSIQYNFLQWTLVLLATFVSGSVLLLTILPALRLSKHKFFLSIGILCCHLFLAAGFMLYFFHVPSTEAVIVHNPTTEAVKQAIISVANTTTKHV